MPRFLGSVDNVPLVGAVRISMTMGYPSHVRLDKAMWNAICDLAPDRTVAASARTTFGVTSSASARPPSSKIFMTTSPRVHRCES
jgi:hypothetical protein